MNLNQIIEVAETAQELPEELQKPILTLIDTKTDEDMKEVISEMIRVNTVLLAVQTQIDTADKKSRNRMILGFTGLGIFVALLAIVVPFFFK